MGEESSSEGFGTGLGDLPESSIASILSLLSSPRDVARLACVSRSFRAASDSDVVWQRMLPSFYADILAEAQFDHDTPASTSSSKKEVYNSLCNRVLLRNGTRDFWLDRASGASCQSIGARELDVIWGNDDSYWGWRSQVGARFTEVAYLKHVWWLEVKGRWQCRLLPGTYTFSWRLSLPAGRDPRHDFYNKIGPVTFSFEASGNAPVGTKCYLTGQGARIPTGGWSEGEQQPLGYRWDSDTWMELDVGEFTVEMGESLFEIEFHLKEVNCGRTKSGLNIDCVMIRPSITTQTRISLSELEVPELSRHEHPRRFSNRRPFRVNP